MVEAPEDDPLKGQRRVVFDLDQVNEVDIFERRHIAVGGTVAGPAVIEQPDTTTVLYSNWSATVVESGELILKKGTAS